MPEHLLFLTGTLAEPGLRRVLGELQAPAFSWEVRQLGIKVAALMTGEHILRRLDDIGPADRVILPGRCRGDLETLSARYGVPFERGPEELMDLPEWLGQAGRPVDLSAYRIRIFAEIVDAPRLTLEELGARAAAYRADGADVIDLGCLPGVPFPHLADAVRYLKDAGFRVSVDSLQDDDLLTGGRAGADYLLSLTEQTLWIADEVAATPVLIPVDGDLEGLYRAWASLRAKGKDPLLDPVLDPIHFGFTTSLLRYHAVRQRCSDARMMMGTGNLTELTEADTAGINALLLGIASELDIDHLLTTQVSPHCRSVVRELDLGRRIMYRAARDRMLPKQIDPGLTGLHERKPHPYDLAAIQAAAAQVKDRNWRIQVSAEGIHVYNRDGLHSAADPYELYPKLGVEQDGGHAFYLGLELGRAEIALNLGKRYTQDQPLRWGCALPAPAQDLEHYAAPASTKRRGKA